MGFCLFEHTDMHGMFFAINAAHVFDVELLEETSLDRPVSRIRCDFSPNGVEIQAVGAPEDIKKMLMDTAKIGVKKAEIYILTGLGNVKPLPLLFNYADQVVMVCEMPGETVPENDGSFVTASQLFMNDGTIKVMVERPGVFANQINAKGRVPILQL